MIDCVLKDWLVFLMVRMMRLMIWWHMLNLKKKALGKFENTIVLVELNTKFSRNEMVLNCHIFLPCICEDCMALDVR